MANYNLNFVRFFKEKSIVYYIGVNVLHMSYTCTCTIQAKGKYKGQSRGYYMAIT